MLLAASHSYRGTRLVCSALPMHRWCRCLLLVKFSLSMFLASCNHPCPALSLSPLMQLRCQLYSTTCQLLTSAGVGAARPLAPALLQAAAAELYGRKRQEGAADAGAGAVEGPARKKARKGKQAPAAVDDAAATGAEEGSAALGEWQLRGWRFTMPLRPVRVPLVFHTCSGEG